jgi:hypothetical protein
LAGGIADLGERVAAGESMCRVKTIAERSGRGKMRNRSFGPAC